MKNFFKVFICAAMIFSFSSANVSAADVNLTDDDIAAFLAKCNQELSKTDPNNSLDFPKRITYKDSVVLNNTKITLTYTVINNKVYGIDIESDKYSEDIQPFFEGMGIVYLKALGLNDEDAREIIANKKGKFIDGLARFVEVQFADGILKIRANNAKQN